MPIQQKKKITWHFWLKMQIIFYTVFEIWLEVWLRSKLKLITTGMLLNISKAEKKIIWFYTTKGLEKYIFFSPNWRILDFFGLLFVIQNLPFALDIFLRVNRRRFVIVGHDFNIGFNSGRSFNIRFTIDLNRDRSILTQFGWWYLLRLNPQPDLLRDGGRGNGKLQWRKHFLMLAPCCTTHIFSCPLM